MTKSAFNRKLANWIDLACRKKMHFCSLPEIRFPALSSLLFSFLHSAVKSRLANPDVLVRSESGFFMAGGSGSFLKVVSGFFSLEVRIRVKSTWIRSPGLLDSS